MQAEQSSKEPLQQVTQAHPALFRAFSIADWNVLPEFNRLQHQTESSTRRLEPRLINLLCYFAANSERVLSRDELVQELWPQVIVNENSLTRAVSELRKQLQSSTSTLTNYIETIPKKGYRLIAEVKPIKTLRNQPIQKSKFDLWQNSGRKWQYGSAISALCISLFIIGWLSLDPRDSIFQKQNTPLISDEILESNSDFLGGEVILSNMRDSQAVVESIATPVVSLDETQYAFIQYDSNGSTIFFGRLGTAIEPMPVYYNNRHLFNLTWSPIGNSLLFAMKQSRATAVVYSSISETADLLMLNLNTLETSRLTQEMDPISKESTNGLNLT